jgi:hypothetical protein
MNPEARGLAPDGSPPGYLEVSYPAGCDFVRDGWSMPPSLKNRTACPGPELLSCELHANPAAVAGVLVLNVHKIPSLALSRKEGMGQNSIVRSLPPLLS